MSADDLEWVRRTLEGESTAFDHLVGKYMHRAYGMAYRLTGDPQEVEDLTQEAFLKAYRGLRGFRGESSFFTWFCTILIHLCRDHLRKKRFRSRFLGQGRQTPGERDQEAPEWEIPDTNWRRNPEAVLEQNQWAGLVQETLAKLPVRQRTIFVLRHFQGLRLREIAKILKISEGTVKTHLFRAVQTLRAELADSSGKERP